MIKELILPDLGEGIDGAEVSEILVSIGDTIKTDETVLVLESEKASMEIPSETSGKILEILVSIGETIKTGQRLIKIESPKEPAKETSKKEKREKNSRPVSVGPPPKTRQKEKALEADETGPTENIFASPGVRRLARELGINLQIIKGTGEKGRITKDDLNGYIKIQMMISSGNISASRPAVNFSRWGEVEVQKLSKIQRITGQRLQQAWQTIPHVTQFDQANITELEQHRKKLKKKLEKKRTKVTLLPFLITAVTRMLKEFPVFNSSLDSTEENLVIKNYYNIGIAVDTPSGLTVPVIKEADRKSIIELSEEIIDLSERARAKKLNADEMKGGTFTISSLGGIGGRFFTPIINPPEVAILGVSRSYWGNKKDQQVKEKTRAYLLPFSLSYDHRVIDGAAAASFTTKLSETLSNKSLFEEK